VEQTQHGNLGPSGVPRLSCASRRPEAHKHGTPGSSMTSPPPLYRDVKRRVEAQ